MGDSTHIFLSYAHTDVSIALRLASDLKNIGANIWMDRLDAKPSADWRQSLQRAITDSALLLPVLSSDYITSRYGQRELTQAIRMGINIIPVLLHQLPDEQWPTFIPQQYVIDLSGHADENLYRSQLRELVDLLMQRAPAHISTPPSPEIQYVNSLIATLETPERITELLMLAPTNKAKSLNQDIRPEPVQRYAQTYHLLPDSGDTPASRTRPIPFDDVVKVGLEHPRFALIGAAGSGKTFSMRLLVRDAARRYREAPRVAPLPLLINLHDWDTDVDVAGLIRSHWPLATDPLKGLAQGKVALYLDGLSDIQHQKLYAKKLELLADWISSKTAPQRLVITCRAADFHTGVQLGLPLAELQPIEPVAVEQIVELAQDEETTFSARANYQEETNPTTQVLEKIVLQEPFLITVLNLTEGSGTLLKTGTAAVLKFLVQMLGDFQTARDTTSPEAARDLFNRIESSLTKLALYMIEAPVGVYVSIKDASQHAGMDATILLAASEAGLLDVHRHEIRFPHELLKQYFGALGLRSGDLFTRITKPQLDSTLRRQSSKWDTVISLLIELSADPEALVLTIAKVDPYLAFRCIANATNIKVTSYQSILDQLPEDVRIAGDYRLGVANILVGVDDKSALYILLEVLREGNPAARQAAGVVFQRVDVEPLSGLVHSITHLDDTNRETARQSLRLLRGQALPTLLHLLHDSSWHRRRGAAWGLGELMDKAAVPLLLKALDDSDDTVRVAAAFALGRIGDPIAFPALIAALGHTNWRINRAASQALAHMGEASLPYLVEVLKQRTSPTRQRVQAITVLAHLGRPEAAAIILKLTRSRNVEERYAAVDALKEYPGAVSTKRLVECLADEDKPRWSKWRIADLAAAILNTQDDDTAANALRKWQQKRGQIPADSSSKIAKRRLMAEDGPPAFKTDWVARRDAVIALGLAKASSAIPRLMIALDDEDNQVKIAAIDTLMRFKSDRRVLPTLFKALHDEDHLVCDMAHDAIIKIAAAPVPGLQEAIHSLNLNVRALAIDIAGGLADATVVPDLIECLPDLRKVWLSDQRLCDIALTSLQAIGTPEALEAVSQWHGGQETAAEPVVEEAPKREPYRDPLGDILDDLYSDDWSIRQEASKTLREYARQLRGKSDSFSTQRLVSKLTDNDWAIRCAVIEALAWMRDPSTVPAIAITIHDENWMVRSAAIRAMMEIALPGSADIIAQSLTDENSMVREAAAESLGFLNDVSAVDALVEALTDVEHFVRLAAIEALGQIQSTAAVTPVRILLNDPDSTIRWYAAEALRKIAHPSTVLDLIPLLHDDDCPPWESQSISEVVVKALEAIDTPEAHIALERWYSASQSDQISSE